MLAGTETAGPAPRWMTVALFASLALNLIVVGAAAGFVWRHGARLAPADTAQLLPPNVLSYTSLLPAGRQKELAALTEHERAQVRPLRRQLREAREEVVKVMVAEPFDRQRFQDAQANLLVADQKAREAVYRLYTEIAAGMTADERRGFANWRQHRRKMPNPLDEPEKQANGVAR
jgi:uncharacterized membrane protein